MTIWIGTSILAILVTAWIVGWINKRKKESGYDLKEKQAAKLDKKKVGDGTPSRTTPSTAEKKREPAQSSSGNQISTSSGMLVSIMIVTVIAATALVMWQLRQIMPSTVERQANESLLTCPDASAAETRSCLRGTNWSNGITLASPAYSGMRLCSNPRMPYEKWDENGQTYWKFKEDAATFARTGRATVLRYRLYTPETDCNDVLL